MSFGRALSALRISSYSPTQNVLELGPMSRYPDSMCVLENPKNLGKRLGNKFLLCK